MAGPESFDEAFRRALLDASLPVPAGLATVARRDAPSPPLRRFNVHRNNVVKGLLDHLAQVHPATERLVGEGFFRAMARAYLEHELPASPVLLEYGGGLASFIPGFAPAADVPYLADVARLEWLIHEAAHAADAEALGPDDLAGLADSNLERLRLALHPSLRLLASEHPAVTLWRLNQDDEAPGPVRLAGAAEHALVVRPGLAVEVRPVPPGAFALAEALRAGSPLAAAARLALSRDAHLDVQSALAGLIESGAVVGYSAAD